MLSPLLYSLFTHDCVAAYDSNIIIKFADHTTVVGLITEHDETAYREEVRDLAVLCQDNNLSLNVSKTKELITKELEALSLQSWTTENGGLSMPPFTSTGL